MKTFPEINALNLSDCRAALAMAEVNFRNVNQGAQDELRLRMAHLQDRIWRLSYTAKMQRKQGVK